MWLLLMVQCIFTEYVNESTAKAMQYCMKDDDGKPTLQPHKPSLASAYIHPNKDHIIMYHCFHATKNKQFYWLH